MSATLTTLRARVRTQLENAVGFPDPLPVTVSSDTRTTLLGRVENMVQDVSNLRWSTTDIDDALLKALDEYNRHSPPIAITTLTLAAAGREVDISSVSNLIRVQKVWWPYDSSDPSWPPNWCQFDVYPGKILALDTPTEPESGDKVRIWYTTPATINGLNSATVTTVPIDDVTYLLNGACFYLAYARAMELAETLNADEDLVKTLTNWATDHGKAFRYGIRQTEPAWQRYAYGYRNDDIDEGVDWALGRFNEIAPQEAVTSLTLAAAGREVDISSVTGLLRVTRAWWPYTSTDPEYPPNWVPFEQWGTTLFLKTGSEPDAGDVVRIWYQKLCTINGLASATSTTIPDDAETLIVTGTVGFVAQERVMEKQGWRVPRDLAEWADQRLKEFERGLKAYAKRQASRHAGSLQLPAMDRWDHTDDDTKW
jgi:hypothetical protein